MCLSKAYLDKDGKRELVMDEVASIRVEGAGLSLKTLFGEQKKIEAEIREVDFSTHIILLQDLR